MEKAGSVWNSVGNTPLIEIRSLSALTGCRVFGKAEFLNPGGSIKDRAAKGIISAAEQSGALGSGGVIVEGTAGNTGIGLATLAAERGYKTVIFMPDNQAREKFLMLEALGAEIFAVPPCAFANEGHFYHQARRHAAEKGYFWADQFENLANAQYHYQSTAPEIWTQLDGVVQVMVTASGTGGTIAGCSNYLKECNPGIEVVVCDPSGSGIFNYIKEGSFKGEGSSITEGIGIMRKTANFAEARIDDAIQVSDSEMIDMMFHVAKHDGLFVGTSSALNLHGAYQMALQYQDSGRHIVTFLCDHGSRYASKVLDPKWLEEKCLRPKPLS